MGCAHNGKAGLRNLKWSCDDASSAWDISSRCPGGNIAAPQNPPRRWEAGHAVSGKLLLIQNPSAAELKSGSAPRDLAKGQVTTL